MDKAVLKQMITAHEGLRLFPYRCSAGFLTIGVGRNLQQRGITHDEAMYLLDNDIDEVITACERFDFWNRLNEARRMVIADMVFNLGLKGFQQFRKLHVALRVQDYKAAAAQMRSSKWFHQVGQRARRLSEAMETGRAPSFSL